MRPSTVKGPLIHLSGHSIIINMSKDYLGNQDDALQCEQSGDFPKIINTDQLHADEHAFLRHGMLGPLSYNHRQFLLRITYFCRSNSKPRFLPSIFFVLLQPEFGSSFFQEGKARQLKLTWR